ncbi:M48 family metallopeptidase [Pseudomonas sp. 5P_3.1_Bac2]|uniref:M48 family metallopeptidase n=1 Tax=Pseudomonas sp. 5P_3.1_Bac2 TaxID=2971617 RepID=UPI0021CAAD4A|nr:M48 family metallopeptidase [Pseudomonas sp. 5P_3.1_Bac2]MCU1717762.1 M48 family metallopeptidase [Pseudomonas sp. 5P_3.1_Bac2]
MDFFEHQARARRSSALLVILLVLAVLSLIAITSLVIGFILQPHTALDTAPTLLYMPWPVIGLVSAVVISVVCLGSLFKWLELRSGGAAIAQRLGGRPVNTAPQDLGEQRVLNVVEEMALASGMPVPIVYVLDDPAINAFAAGLSPQDAVIGITRGALNQLNRDELQGVIAHEFSHILHGDMRLNTQLVAALNGILLLGLLGGFVLRHLPRSRGSSRDGKLVAPIFMIGLALWVLGYTGTFFGRLIRAAVSRQREYLADASAVQYTRYPDGIAGALQRIASSTTGSELHASHAEEFSHLYFAPGVSSWFSSLFATHPPLEKRIQRILPNWDGSLKPQRAPRAEPQPTVVQAPAQAASVLAMGAAIEAIGSPQPSHLAQAQSHLNQLPTLLKQAAHNSQDAQCVLYALLLDAQAQAADKQLRSLQLRLDAGRYEQLLQLREPVQQLATQLRMPLLDLLLPSLKSLASDQRKDMLDNLKLLIRSDAHVSVYEWALLRIVERYLRPLPATYGRQTLAALSEDSTVLLSLLARVGASDELSAQAAFDRGARSLALPKAFMLSEAQCNLRALEAALKRLNQLNPLDKPQLLKAMALVIEHDAQVTAAEAELLRALADILDCPMPPLLRPNP